jgi:hypothetical protein
MPGLLGETEGTDMKNYGYEVRTFGDVFHYTSFESAVRHAKMLPFAKVVDCANWRYIWETGVDMV